MPVSAQSFLKHLGAKNLHTINPDQQRCLWTQFGTQLDTENVFVNPDYSMLIFKSLRTLKNWRRYTDLDAIYPG